MSDFKSDIEGTLGANFADRYLDLLKSALCASLYDESAWRRVGGPLKQQVAAASISGKMIAKLKRAFLGGLQAKNLALVRTVAFDAEIRASGQDHPLFGYTMTGRKRLDALHFCIDEILKADVPGDFIETGVWRGGSAILMRAILNTYGVRDRVVWCADSFEGMPVPKEADRLIETLSDLSDWEYMSVSLEQVRDNFARFGLLDNQVRFLKGWFCDTLPTAPISRLSLLRLDGDLYDSTRDALLHLYDKVSPTGFIIVDDYNSWRGCRMAVDEFRRERGISAKIEWIDSSSILWKVSPQ
jgi:O-methyltransferase